MRIIVSKLQGDATVNFYNKHGDLIHVEGFFGKFTGNDGSLYNREIPVDPMEYGHTTCLFNGAFEYKVHN